MVQTDFHPSPMVLHSFVDGTICWQERDDLDRHISHCLKCLQVMTTFPDCELTRKAREAIRKITVSDDTPPPDEWKRLHS